MLLLVLIPIQPISLSLSIALGLSLRCPFCSLSAVSFTPCLWPSAPCEICSHKVNVNYSPVCQNTPEHQDLLLLIALHLFQKAFVHISLLGEQQKKPEWPGTRIILRNVAFMQKQITPRYNWNS